MKRHPIVRIGKGGGSCQSGKTRVALELPYWPAIAIYPWRSHQVHPNVRVRCALMFTWKEEMSARGTLLSMTGRAKASRDTLTSSGDGECAGDALLLAACPFVRVWKIVFKT